MNSTILRKFCNDYQFFSAAKDSSYPMQTNAFKNLVHEIIRDNVEFSNEGYYLCAHKLSKIEKRQLLKHIISAEDFEYYDQEESLMDAAVADCERDLQAAIDSEIDQVWHEDMQEMGLYLSRHYDNGEIYYTR